MVEVKNWVKGQFYGNLSFISGKYYLINLHTTSIYTDMFISRNKSSFLELDTAGKIVERSSRGHWNQKMKINIWIWNLKNIRWR